MKLEESYLYGLIAGRGHLYKDSKIIAIEFSHSNEFVDGIAHCPKCGWLATKPKGNEDLKCKNHNCENIVDRNVKKRYNQPQSTINSLNNVIIPFLESEIKGEFEISANKSMTLLLINLQTNLKLFDEIEKEFNFAQSFDSFSIPNVIHKSQKEQKIEFINGLLDTSGFANAGGWLNRDGKNGHGRMRAYFQIVRNWKMPVEIDNFLRKYFGLPIQTIDWGHPNIRDGNLTEYYEDEKLTSWSREHQVKFYPEYYKQFRFRVSVKQELFQELIDHNLNVGFEEKQDWFPPGRITIGKVKANHPAENDLRIPEEAQKHFNAFWQVNMALGCEYLNMKKNISSHPEMYELTGEDIDGYKEKLIEYTNQSEKLYNEIVKKEKKNKSKTESQSTARAPRTSPEAETYEPLVNFFKKHLAHKYNEPVEVFDTSSGNLNLFIKNKRLDILNELENFEKYRIRPDVVGFLNKQKKLIFVESKITTLDLSALGQLIGYCLVAKPIEAILVSTRSPSPTFVRILKANKNILKYDDDKTIQIATLTDNQVIFEDI